MGRRVSLEDEVEGGAVHACFSVTCSLTRPRGTRATLSTWSDTDAAMQMGALRQVGYEDVMVYSRNVRMSKARLRIACRHARVDVVRGEQRMRERVCSRARVCACRNSN